MLYAEPGPEDRDAVAAVWLAQLADRFPGRHFRLVTEHERPPGKRPPGPRESDRVSHGPRDQTRPPGEDVG